MVMPDILSHTWQAPWLSSAAPNLPPIRPLEQTRWVRGWVAHCSLRIAEVLVVTAESVGRFSKAEGAQRPGRGWHSLNRGYFGGTRLRLSHLGFQMKGLFKRQEPFACLLTALLLFALCNCVVNAQRDNGALAIPLYAAITVSAMLRLVLVLCVSNPLEHNGLKITKKMTVSWNGANCFISTWQYECLFQAVKAQKNT